MLSVYTGQILNDITVNASLVMALPQEIVSLGTARRGQVSIGRGPSCKARDFGGLTLEADRKMSNGKDASGDHCLPAYLTDAWTGSGLGILPRRGHLGHGLKLAADDFPSLPGIKG